MYLKNEPVPLMRGGTVEDRVRMLDRKEQEVLNYLKNRRVIPSTLQHITRTLAGNPTIQIIRCTLTGAGI